MKTAVKMPTIRVVTYNIHKCRGLDRRVSPERIVEVLRELDGDIIALQEIFSTHSRYRDIDQARFIATELGLNHCFGETCKRRGWSYGNALLSRFPMRQFSNH